MLIRKMIPDPSDGLPLVGVRRNMLGLRPTILNCPNPNQLFDTTAVLDSDVLDPTEFQGLSTNRNPFLLQPDSKAVVWVIDSRSLPVEVAILVDPADNDHCLLGPAYAMTLGMFQAVLASTRSAWRRWP